MKKERPSHKRTSDETNLFCEILADPMNNFMETSQRGKVFDSIIAEFKDSTQLKEKNMKTLKQKRKKPSWWSKSKRFLEEPCNMESKV